MNLITYLKAKIVSKSVLKLKKYRFFCILSFIGNIKLTIEITTNSNELFLTKYMKLFEIF